MQAPDSLGGITVDRTTYIPDLVRDGKIFFRAADHHVPLIIATGLGFEVCNPPEGTDLPDIPRPDPVRDTAIADSQRDLAQLRATVDQQKTELSQAAAAVSVLRAELDDAKLRALELAQEVVELGTTIVALRELIPTTVLKKYDAERKAAAEGASE